MSESTDLREEIIIDIDPEEVTPRQQLMAETRRLLAILEEHPDIKLPYGSYNNPTFYAGSAIEAAAIAKAIGGKWSKNDPNASDYDADNMLLRQQFGVEVKVTISVSRGDVCERKVVGTVRKKVRKLKQAAVYEEVYEDVDKVEFNCGSLLSAAARLQEAEALQGIEAF